MVLDLSRKFDGVRISDEGDDLLDGLTACKLALNYVPEGGDLTSHDKFDRYLLLKRIEDSDGSIEVSTEDLVKLKSVTGAFPFTVRALGCVWDWLEGR